MKTKRPLPYGSWPSPLAAIDVAAASVRMSDVHARDGQLYWIELRPEERGRSVLVSRQADGRIADVTPAPFNVRTRVHEYGGLSYAVAGSRMVFCHFADQLVYVQDRGSLPRAVTPPGYRYADFQLRDDGTLFAVREDHTGPGEPTNTVVAFDLTQSHEGAGRVLFDDADFVAYPRSSPAGDRLAFIRWDHPRMPWDGSELVVGSIRNGTLVDPQVVAGGPEESVLEPQWDADGTLYFLSDRTGWWNLYRWRDGQTQAVAPQAVEFGGPLWLVGHTTYALTGDGHAICRICQRAVDELVAIDLRTGTTTPVPLPYVMIDSIAQTDPATTVVLAWPADGPAALVSVDVRQGTHDVVHQPSPNTLRASAISRAEAIEFPTAAGPGGEPRRAHAFFYSPVHPDYEGPPGEAPPAIVEVHGGPTAHADAAFRPKVQYWTTRGFAMVDVNYGGSTGYGRAYRERLDGQWGIVDVEDVVAAVDYLATTGRIDPQRTIIRGGSAGGYTVLAALAETRRFAAGINYFGVSDLEALVADTHKFEARYLDRLLAPLPEGRDLYVARSPIHHLDALDAPLLTLQGSEDKVVPPEQSRAIVAAVARRGRPVAYLEFDGEQHGFRQAANIVRALEAELYFLGRVFGFTPADRLEPIPIENLD